MAATVALVQTDIKRVLAYSTVSQLGYMFLACGVGAFGVAVFHLFTHAFFKALLFLGSGSVIHAMSGEQDMTKMGGLRRKIPWTFWTFAIGALAIAGIPPLSGFYSKDEILLGTLNAEQPVLFAIGLFTALLTAFYMARLVFLTFFGGFRGSHEAEHHVHESPFTMLVPLVLLAVGSAVVGMFHVPFLVQPVFRLPFEHEAHIAWLPWLATATAVLGIVLGYLLYVRSPAVPGRLAQTFAPFRRVLEGKYYWDDLYDGFVRGPVVKGSEALLWKWFDAGLVDGAVNGTAAVAADLAARVRLVQSGYVRAYALATLGGAVALFGYLLWR
jgi:NADH-quinone oxidoreductase subunit L